MSTHKLDRPKAAIIAVVAVAVAVLASSMASAATKMYVVCNQWSEC